MKTTINTTAAKTLETLTAGLEVGQSRKIANSEAFMAVHVERIGENLFSVAHYGEQNGDLMADPEMVFLSTAGYWQPVSITQHYVGSYREAIVFEDGKPSGVRPRLLAELCSFAGMWMKNIREQQGLKLKRS